MSYKVTKPYPHGVFNWADVQSKDMETTKTFFTQLLGWTYQDLPTNQGVDYTMFQLDGAAVAGGYPMDKNDTAPMSYWLQYIAVDTVDATVEKAVSLGATVSMPAIDVMDSGRMAGITDPTGAAVMFWEAKTHIGAGVVNTVGAMCWNELLTHDLSASQEFYSGLFGWSFTKDDREYYTITHNGRMNGGMMAIKPEWGTVPDTWVVYFTVSNLEEAISKVKALGGTVEGDTIDAGETGRIAMIADPTGAHCNLIQMKVTPEEWKEAV